MDRWLPYLFVPIPHFFFEAEIFNDFELFHFLCFAMNSTFRHEYPENFCFHGQVVTLEMGEFIFGRSHWAKKLNLSENKVRHLLNRLINQQWIAKVTSKTTSKMTIYKWLWNRFPQSSRRQNYQHKTRSKPPDSPQTKNKNIEKEAATAQVHSIADPCAVVAASFALDDAAKNLLAPLPLEEQIAVLELLKQSKSSNSIKNEMGWLRKCIEVGWHKNKVTSKEISSPAANKELAHAVCHWYSNQTDIEFRIFQDFFILKHESGQEIQLFFRDDELQFKGKVISGIKKLGFNPPTHIFQE